uniref:Chromo domain-containing protein n=1 Tax=Salarias fasciatus TaxID=181472 RepID=A0A672GBR8_SALFA
MREAQKKETVVKTMRKKQTAKQQKTKETTVLQEFAVDQIICRRVFDGSVEYFLKWKGFTDAETRGNPRTIWTALNSSRSS